MNAMAGGNQPAGRVRDPVHGLVVFGDGGDRYRDETDRIAWRLIDTREFQRLRRIRQLGFSDLVFPGATHSRFAHSIGAYHMARRLAEVIARREERNPDRERIALLATLLHDIGHGPFSHAFETVARSTGRSRRHEEWSAEIVQGETEVNSVLRTVDEGLPTEIGALLMEEEPRDIYSTIVSSQFDADRLDFIQRDRTMTGVEFGHIDRDWIFDCLEVGSITIGKDNPREASCLCLGPKGLSVAEEYLEARFRLYRTVYMHKTTRAAEKMLEALLCAAAEKLKDAEAARRDPVLRYLTGQATGIHAYLDLDDAAVWGALTTLSGHTEDEELSNSARCLRDRKLYKCLDIGAHDEAGGNLHLRFRRALKEREVAWRGDLLFDDPEIKSYLWYDFDSDSALNKVLVRSPKENEPLDIADISPVVKTLRGAERLQRVYAPDADRARELWNILEEL